MGDMKSTGKHTGRLQTCGLSLRYVFHMVEVFVIVFVTAIFVSYVSAVQVKEKLNLHLCEKMILNVSMNISLLICSTYIHCHNTVKDWL